MTDSRTYFGSLVTGSQGGHTAHEIDARETEEDLNSEKSRLKRKQT